MPKMSCIRHFLKIIEILDTISEIRSHKTRSLIVTITERKAIDLYRSKSRAAVLPLDETYIGSVAANEIEHMRESDAIAAAIAALPARYREVLLLRYDNGFSYSEIAKALDMTEAAVRKTRTARERGVAAHITDTGGRYR